MLSLVRGNMERKGKIEVAKAAKLLVEAERIKEEFNLLNAEMCRELGREYKPPYEFENPLKGETVNQISPACLRLSVNVAGSELSHVIMKQEQPYAMKQNQDHLFKTRSRSAIRSSGSSSPTDRRIRVSLIPRAARSAGGMAA